MGHAIFDPETRRKASRETFSSAGDEVRLVEEASKIRGSGTVFKRIAAAKTVGDLLDCTTEFRYALVFDILHFGVRFVPSGTGVMPDLLVSRDGESAYVEIRRIRPPDPFGMPTHLQRPSEDLVKNFFYKCGGDEDVRKIEQELRSKFRQAQAVKGNWTIIATWSDRDFVDEVDFEHAVRNISQSPADPNDRRPIPDGLMFCIFGRFWMNGQTGQQLSCEPVRQLKEPFLKWTAELERSRS